MPHFTSTQRKQLHTFFDAHVASSMNSRTTAITSTTYLTHANKRKERHDGCHYVLRQLLEINLNTPLSTLPDHIKNNFNQEEQEECVILHIESILVQAFPSLFQRNQEECLDVVPSARDSELIRAGLGFDLDQTEHLHPLNLAQLRHPVLHDLYLRDGNILWMVLQSIKPITPEFTAEDKIDCYIELAQAFYRRATPALYKTLFEGDLESQFTQRCIITPGINKAQQGALNMARCAYAIALTQPALKDKVNNAFCPTQKPGLWANITNSDSRFITWFSLYCNEQQWNETCNEIAKKVLGVHELPSPGSNPSLG